MNKNFIIQEISNEVFGSVRYSIVNGIPYFCLNDICKKLGFDIDSNPITRLKNNILNLEKVYTEFDNYIENRWIIKIPVLVQTGFKSDSSPAEQVVNMIFTTDTGVYYIIMRSNKYESVDFKKWIVGILLPTVKQIAFDKYVQAIQQYNMKLISENSRLENDFVNLQNNFSFQTMDLVSLNIEKNRYKSNIENANFLTEDQKHQLLDLEDNNEEGQESY